MFIYVISKLYVQIRFISLNYINNVIYVGLITHKYTRNTARSISDLDAAQLIVSNCTKLTPTSEVADRSRL
jgi:hypothetical protein